MVDITQQNDFDLNEKNESRKRFTNEKNISSTKTQQQTIERDLNKLFDNNDFLNIVEKTTVSAFFFSKYFKSIDKILFIEI